MAFSCYFFEPTAVVTHLCLMFTQKLDYYVYFLLVFVSFLDLNFTLRDATDPLLHASYRSTLEAFIRLFSFCFVEGNGTENKSYEMRKKKIYIYMYNCKTIVMRVILAEDTQKNTKKKLPTVTYYEEN